MSDIISAYGSHLNMIKLHHTLQGILQQISKLNKCVGEKMRNSTFKKKLES